MWSVVGYTFNSCGTIVSVDTLYLVCCYYVVQKGDRQVILLISFTPIGNFQLSDRSFFLCLAPKEYIYFHQLCRSCGYLGETEQTCNVVGARKSSLTNDF